MPLPTPNENEKENDFISRCVSTLNDRDEGKDNDQRVAMCYSQWREKKSVQKIGKQINQEVNVSSETQKEFDNVTSSLELDLTAYFSMMRDDMISLVQKAIEETWSPDQLINEIEKLLIEK